MNQIIDVTDKEKFEIYNSLEKDVIIIMLIECNKQLQKLVPKIEISKCFYLSGNDTSCRCINCGKQKWEH